MAGQAYLFAPQLTSTGSIEVDNSGSNQGTYVPSLQFGPIDSGETIASAQSGGVPNQFGLDFYTAAVPRMSITNSGVVGIGILEPVTQLVVLARSATPPKTQAIAGARLITIMGTIYEDGDKLRFVTDQRSWRVDNPEILKGHDGHYVHAMAYVYPERNSIHITEVKLPTPSETEKDDIK